MCLPLSVRPHYRNGHRYNHHYCNLRHFNYEMLVSWKTQAHKHGISLTDSWGMLMTIPPTSDTVHARGWVYPSRVTDVVLVGTGAPRYSGPVGHVSTRAYTVFREPDRVVYLWKKGSRNIQCSGSISAQCTCKTKRVREYLQHPGSLSMHYTCKKKVSRQPFCIAYLWKKVQGIFSVQAAFLHSVPETKRSKQYSVFRQHFCTVYLWNKKVQGTFTASRQPFHTVYL